MAGFGFSLPKLGAGSVMGSADLPLSDKLTALAMILKGDPSAGLQMRQMAMQRQLYQQLLGGDGAPGASPSQTVQNSTDVQPGSVNGAPLPKVPQMSDLGGVSLPQLNVKAPVAPVPMTPPPQTASAQPQQSRAFLDPNDPATARRLNLLSILNPQSAQALARVAMATRPDMVVGPDGVARNSHDPNAFQGRISNPTAVNNTIVDMTDPGNVNRVIPSSPVPGAKPVYDNRGNVVDWTLPPGARQAIQDAQAETIRHNMTDEAINRANAATARQNAGTSAGGLQNTRTQNPYVPPAGFVVRQKGR